jgi:hypothetical protein
MCKIAALDICYRFLLSFLRIKATIAFAMLFLDDTITELQLELARVNQAIAALEGVSQTPPAPTKRRGRKTMGYEERLAVSKRITKYWAERRQQRTTSAQQG